MKKHEIVLPDEMAMVMLGAALAAACCQICIIYLYGDIGTGKTTFCRGFLHALGYTGNIKSPTYTIVETYVLPYWTVYHIDLYRLTLPEELEVIGIREYFDNTAMCLVEWPQRGEGLLPIADIALTLRHYHNDKRQAQVCSFSVIGEQILSRLTPIKRKI